VAAEGVAIADITVQGTVAADVNDDPPGLRNTGFEKSELTEGEGNEGAVSAVVLSFTMPITLEATGDAVIARITLAGSVEVPAADAVAVGDILDAGRVAFVDGRQGSGQPVENNVTWTGQTIKPSLGECVIQVEIDPVPEICPVPDANGYQMFFAASEYIESGDQLADALESSVPEGDPNTTVIDSEVPAEGGSVELIAAISSNGASGVQGWSIAVAGQFDDATTMATAGGDVNDDVPGLRNTGFEKTELTTGAGNEGAVSAVVCSFTMPITLMPQGSASVLRISLSGVPGDSADVVWTDGLTGAGQPVDNVATVDGGTVNFVCQQSAIVNFTEIQTRFAAVGDGNDDGRLDLADAIYILNALFRNGPSPACPAAADANGDTMMDSSDAIFIIEYLWLGGPAPSNVGGCTEVDPAACPDGSSSCA
ncbi:MAG: dockerin type I repeat-containing protein, partial [Planctomycetota bacterium]